MTMQKASIGQAYLLETRFECLRVLRTPGFSVPILLLPVAFYLLLGVAMAGEAGAGSVYYFVSFAIYGVLGPGLIGIGSLLSSDRSQGILEFKRALPMPYASYVISKLLMAVVLSIVVTIMIALLAAFVGGVALNASQFTLVAVIVILGVAPVSAIGLVIASFAPPSGASAIAGTLLVAMAILAGLFYPLPETFETLRPIWPTYYLQQLALAAAGEPSTGGKLTHIAMLIGITGAFGFLAAKRLARSR
jgi:ABC-2 type transport system permease protein